MAVSQGDTDRAVAAFRALDFHVHCDSVETPTARFADYFLPVNTPWEREALRNGFEVTQEAESLIQLRQPMIPSAGESRSDAEIVFDLAPRLGMGEAFFGGDIDKARAWQLEPVGLSLAELRARPEGIRRDLAYRPRKYAEPRGAGVTGFATPTGLVEVYSQRLRDHGHAPVPDFPESAIDSEEAAAFPLLLTSAKSPYYCHSQQRHIASLRRRKPAPTVTLHPDTAEAAGLAPGDRAAGAQRDDPDDANARALGEGQHIARPDRLVRFADRLPVHPHLSPPGTWPWRGYGSCKSAHTRATCRAAGFRAARPSTHPVLQFLQLRKG